MDTQENIDTTLTTTLESEENPSLQESNETPQAMETEETPADTIELTQESEVTDDAGVRSHRRRHHCERRPGAQAEKSSLRGAETQTEEDEGARHRYQQGAVKRTVSARSTPEEKATKRTKSEPGVVSYKAALKGIRAAIIPKDYPASVVTEESVGAIREALMAVIDKADRAPRFETSRLMDDYYGVICAEEDSFNRATRDYLAKETNWKLVRSDELPKLTKETNWKLVRSDELPKLKRVLAFLPETTKEDLAMGLKRLERQNPGLRVGRWVILGSKSSDKGLHVSLRIDKESEVALDGSEWRP
ncbi:protein of unknown function (DUF4780) [Popillia japonica]|uniref:DUF4780 domain-containing protein n=1 Tax=Popillia japonica TaxID=7064 RepID=A0AAW1HST0_POPJA